MCTHGFLQTGFLPFPPTAETLTSMANTDLPVRTDVSIPFQLDIQRGLRSLW